MARKRKKLAERWWAIWLLIGLFFAIAFISLDSAEIDTWGNEFIDLFELPDDGETLRF